MMQIAVIGFLTVLFLVSSVKAQYVFPTPTPTPKASPTPAPAPGPPPCPTVNVQSQGGQRIRDGQRVTFSANISGGDPKVTPTIVWSTSAGYITDGNHTRRIEVDTAGAGATPDREVRAEVWIGGYPPECPVLQAAGTVKIIPPATKYGEFGLVDDATLKTNLENVSTFLAQSPDNLFLIAYAGRNSERGFAYNWLRRMKEAILTPGMSPRKVSGVDGGFREEPMFEFWMVPVGADPPRPTPTLKRTDIVQPSGPPRRP
jgi:hypothetical protein